MSNREQDKRVAEILGWKNIKPIPGFPSALSGEHPKGNLFVDVPRFTTDPAVDYKVLEWAREQEGAPSLFAKMTELICSKSEPVPDAVSLLECYEPGDYSRALLALDEQGVLK